MKNTLLTVTCLLLAVAPSAQDLAATESDLYAEVMMARQQIPDAAARARMTELTNYRSRHTVRHEEGPLQVVAWPIADAARGTLRIWATQEARSEASLALQAQNPQRVLALFDAGGSARAGALAALRAATQDEMSVLLANSVSADIEPRGPLFAEIALRSVPAATDLYSALLNQATGPGEGRWQINLLRSVPTRFKPAAAAAVLRAAAANPGLRSQALTEHAKLTSWDDETRRYLRAVLYASDSREAWAAAAHAIARAPDPVLRREAVDGLNATRSVAAETQLRRAFVLMQSDDAQARATLQRALERKAFGEHDAQVRQWTQP